MGDRGTSVVCLTCFHIRVLFNYFVDFLYTLFLAVDVNFKLKGKDRGIDDLELAPGWASFIKEARYQKHIVQYVDQAKVCGH